MQIYKIPFDKHGVGNIKKRFVSIELAEVKICIRICKFLGNYI